MADIRDYWASLDEDGCYPHPRELDKIRNIRKESKDKNIPEEDHPGWGWWLCRPCGTWHRNETTK